MFLSLDLCASLWFLRFDLESLWLLTLCVCKFVCALFVYVISLQFFWPMVFVVPAVAPSLPPGSSQREEGGGEEEEVVEEGMCHPAHGCNMELYTPEQLFYHRPLEAPVSPKRKRTTIGTKAGRREVSEPNCTTNSSHFWKGQKGFKIEVGRVNIFRIVK